MNTDKKPLPTILAILAGLFVLAHVIIFIQYTTLSPCEAAAHRIVDAKYESVPKPKSAGEALGQALGRSMGEKTLFALAYAEVKQRPVTACYSIALGFSEPK